MARTNAKSPARRTARRTGTKRRAVPKPASTVRSKARPPQRFVASHHREEDFQGGLRSYANYRDLGIADATGGLARAHVIRLVGPCNPEEVSKLHFHDVEFQMVYVLKGWVKSYLEGVGETTFQVGSSWTLFIQPSRSATWMWT